MEMGLPEGGIAFASNVRLPIGNFYTPVMFFIDAVPMDPQPLFVHCELTHAQWAEQIRIRAAALGAPPGDAERDIARGVVRRDYYYWVTSD
jgi:hypothetical protein